eukprot:5967469-Amphidinium_carterae.1
MIRDSGWAGMGAMHSSVIANVKYTKAAKISGPGIRRRTCSVRVTDSVQTPIYSIPVPQLTTFA